MSYPVILYYKYIDIADPAELANTQRGLCGSLGLKGRILVATEGINGTLAGPICAIEEYIDALRADKRFADIEIKMTTGNVETFPKLSVRVRSELVALQAQQPLRADQHNHLSPAEWKEMIEQDPHIVLLDVRNNYEVAAGKEASNVLHWRDPVRKSFRSLPLQRIQSSLPTARWDYELPTGIRE
jgi:UPF0176 protein